MNIKKPLLVLGAVTGVGLASITGLGVASAATNTTSNGQDGIIDKLVTKFHLDREEVVEVFQEQKAERQAQHQQKIEDRLTQAVEEGKLTEAQKTKIIAKLAELKSQRQDWKDKTPEERREARQELHQSLEQWAEDNSVPLYYLQLKPEPFIGF